MKTWESPWWECCGPRYWCWGCPGGRPSGGQSPGPEDKTCWTSGCCSHGADISRQRSGSRECGSPIVGEMLQLLQISRCLLFTFRTAEATLRWWSFGRISQSKWDREFPFKKDVVRSERNWSKRDKDCSRAWLSRETNWTQICQFLFVLLYNCCFTFIK